MKGCIKDKVLFYLEGFLSEKENETFQRHLSSCSECQRELRELQRLRELLKTTEEAPSPNFSRILSLFQKRKVKKPAQLPRFSWRLVFIPAGVFALLFSLLFRSKPELYLPVDLSYYEIIENIPGAIGEEMEREFLSTGDIEKLAEEIIDKISYEALLEDLDKKEKEVLIKELIGGES